MITEEHYTTQNDHPEDRIFRDKEYINRLQKHIDEVYEKLSLDLRLNDRGKDLLFDYLYNCDEDIEFEDYLHRFGNSYEELAFKKPRKIRY
jgi:hypothetical protein